LRKKKFNLRKTYFFDETKRIESYLRRWFFCLVFSVSLFKFQVVFLFDTQNFSCTSVYLRHANKITKRLQSAICYFILFGPNVFFVVENLLFGVLDFVEYRTWKKTSQHLS
jgi:hypothetical protein